MTNRFPNLTAGPQGFTLSDRGGRVRIHSLKDSGRGTVLVFKGNKKPKAIHI